MNRLLPSFFISLLTLLALPVSAANILILGTTLSVSPPNDNEEQIAINEGHTVSVVDAATWAAMTAPQFAAFDAIIFAEKYCDDGNTSDLDPADANKGVWSPAITGNIYIHTFDAVYHNEGQYEAMLANAINFVANGSGTGLFYGNGCRDFDGPLAFLDQVTAVSINNSDDPDNISIVDAAHPAMAGLTDSGLSNWGSSAHATMTSFPGLVQLAVASDASDEAVIIASAADSLSVPTLPPLALIGLAGGIMFLACLVLRRRFAL
jgi:hypothetical protein